MNSNDSLGQSIVKATRFIMEVQKDVVALLGATAKLMDKRGWDRWDWEGGDEREFRPDHAVLFGPKSLPESAQKMPCAIALHLELQPPEPLLEPVCIVAVLRYDRPIHYKELWHQWEREDGFSLLRILTNQTGIPQRVKTDDVEGVFGRADALAAFAVPMCSLTGIESVERKLISPAMQAAADLRIFVNDRAGQRIKR